MAAGKDDAKDERQAWDSVAGAWRKHWRFVEEATRDLNTRLIEQASIVEGNSVLDVACGQGEPALTAARHVGPRGRVTATDFSKGMLDEARERATASGLTNLDFLELDAQALGFEPRTFDAATCRWGLMLIPDPRAALREIFGSLKPGGRLAAAVWGPPDRVPFITLPRDVATRELGLPPPPEPGIDAPPNPMRLAHPGMLEELFREAGFEDVRSESVAVTFRFASPEEYVAVVRDMSSTMRGMLDEHPEEVRERVWSGIAVEAGKYRDGKGRVALPNAAPCVWGRRT